MRTDFFRYILPGCYFAMAMAVANAQSDCPPFSHLVRVEINPDQFWQEISWKITNADGTVVWHKDRCNFDSLLIRNYCVPANQCVVFTIEDEFGDGMSPDGYYHLYLNNQKVFSNTKGNIGRSESTFMGCPVGTHCSNPLTAALGNLPKGPRREAWYRFTPTVNGTYELSTCAGAKTCAAGIWVYSTCNGALLSNGPTGALFFSNQGCTNKGALATLYLAARQPYFFRIAYTDSLCQTDSVQAVFTYKGPVKGCMDAKACNYNPLAEITDICIYPDDPRCTDGPDLLVIEDSIRNQLRLQFIPAPTECGIIDGCFRGVKDRWMLEFGTYVKNIGNRDFYVGAPPPDTSKNDGRFFWDICHQHWHYRGYAEYILFDAKGKRLAGGSKVGFCLFDRECNDGGLGKYSCRNMGISAGCGDFYERTLPCQSLDISGLAAGLYTLAVRVNWTRQPDLLGRVEKGYDNNWGQACFDLSYGKDGKPRLRLSAPCTPYTDCAGVRFGNAQPDCEGKCGGTIYHGDWNRNGVRNAEDVKACLTGILEKKSASACTDLFADGQLDVYDAALLQECVQYGAKNEYWNLRFPCQFPGGLYNPDEVVQLGVSGFSSASQTFQISMLNPAEGLVGLDFSVRGVEIERIESLTPGFAGQIQFNREGRILVLGTAENSIPVHKNPTAVLRIKYRKLTGEPFCLQPSVVAVNRLYQKVDVKVGSGRCRVISSERAGQPLPIRPDFGFYISPNPWQTTTTLHFENRPEGPLQVEITDLTGKIVRSHLVTEGASLLLERKGLPPGVYFISAEGASGKATRRVVAE
jgi:hypothetical protein